MNKSVKTSNSQRIFQLWDITITLSEEFVQPTPLNKLCDLTDYINSCIFESLEHFRVKNPDESKHYIRYVAKVKEYINAGSRLKYTIRNVLSFFSYCYINKNTYVYGSNNAFFHNVFGSNYLTTLDYMVFIWCVYLLKEKLLLDERLIKINYYENGNLFYKGFQEIIEDTLDNFTMRCNRRSSTFSISKIDTFEFNDTALPNEIRLKIEADKCRKTFVYKLWKYNFSYFIVDYKNPQLGRMTYLRFL